MNKAYDSTSVDNREKLNTLSTWKSQQWLSGSEYQNACKLFPTQFYQPNFFVKIGLFIFSIVVINSTWGFLYIFFLSPFIDSEIAFEILSVVYGIALIFLLEYTIKKFHYYRSGTDNALLYAAFGYFLFAFFSITDFELEAWVYCSVVILLLIPALVRYGDPVVSIGVYINLVAIFYLWMTKFELGKTVLPFVVMAVSAVVYFAVNRWKSSSKTYYYTDAQDIIIILSLLTFYLGGNYFVVREGNALLNDLTSSTQINLAFLFYFFTTAIPVVYISVGLKHENRKHFIIGLFSAVISVVTYLHYFSTIPGEWESAIGGILLITLAIGTIKLLKEPKNNITSEADDSENPRDFEALIISQIAQPGVDNQEGFRFSGGDFGGSGGGSEY